MNRISVLFFLVDIYFSYLFIHEIDKLRVMCGIPLIRYNYHYKYNTRATPGRSQLVYYIKESIFNYMCVSGEVTREPGYVAKICYTRS